MVFLTSQRPRSHDLASVRPRVQLKNCHYLVIKVRPQNPHLRLRLKCTKVRKTCSPDSRTALFKASCPCLHVGRLWAAFSAWTSSHVVHTQIQGLSLSHPPNTAALFVTPPSCRATLPQVPVLTWAFDYHINSQGAFMPMRATRNHEGGVINSRKMQWRKNILTWDFNQRRRSWKSFFMTAVDTVVGRGSVTAFDN